MFCLLKPQGALKSPEVKKKIQHVTWPWTLTPYRPENRSSPAVTAYFVLLSTFRLPSPQLFTVPRTRITERGWNHSSHSFPRAERKMWSAEDNVTSKRVKGLFVAFLHLKCPYRQIISSSLSPVKMNYRSFCGKAAVPFCGGVRGFLWWISLKDDVMYISVEAFLPQISTPLFSRILALMLYLKQCTSVYGEHRILEDLSVAWNCGHKLSNVLFSINFILLSSFNF